MVTQNIIEALLSDRDIARLTGFSVHTVRRWRFLNQGPRYLKISNLVRYRPADVKAWLESRPTGGEEPVKNEEAQAVMAAT